MGTSKTRESVFRFKQFEVANSLSAMKVGTDGVLLGAWARVPDAVGVKVLDVGTGSGLISLMLAQRFGNADITGIDIVEEACVEARLNADASPWARRIAIECAGFSEYAGRGVCFDAVVSNPPFFKTEIKASDRERMLARHGAGLDYRLIMQACAAGMLSADGILSMVSPADRQDDITFDMEICGLRLSRLTRVFTKPGAQAPSRLLWEMRRDKKTSPPVVENLLIGSDAYKALTGDFYL
ncbi:methyltransferase domain-containing protein [Muribaculum sp.]|uniref:tRNA1(Val) (adenine(37)-N6)-methyltransferase n=1 Tax=Muribaculum sp. TaxID=1918611 RepID=UPI0023C07F8E|nr:methyltransferase domain-containing protein [Muribaculum sp.]MDE5704898.1 methyltransferase domain-containing protein [Muribaculum sp.]